MLPSSWGQYTPTGWDWGQYIGTFGLFLTCFLLFVRMLPGIAMAEMRELVHHELHHGPHPDDPDGEPLGTVALNGPDEVVAPAGA